MDARTLVAQWIAERREDRDAPALAWVVEHAALALLTCYPAGQGGDILWALFRRVAGQEKEG